MLSTSWSEQPKTLLTLMVRGGKVEMPLSCYEHLYIDTEDITYIRETWYFLSYISAYNTLIVRQQKNKKH